MSSKILIVDDHEIVRTGLCRLIEGHSTWKVCGQAGNGKEAVEKTLALTPDLVLMDISMPTMNGIEATRHIRRLSPATKIVILSLHDDKTVVAQAQEAGADAYVVKSSPSDILLKTLSAILAEVRLPAHDSLRTPSAGKPAD